MSTHTTAPETSDIGRWQRALLEHQDWPSPEAGFVAYVVHTNAALLPLGALALSHSERRRLHEAPMLAAVGFSLASAPVDDATQADWAQGFARLARRDPFPADRISFVHEPVTLLGVCLGAMCCRGPSLDAIGWLREVVTQLDAMIDPTQIWQRLLGALAAHTVSRPWGPRPLPDIDQLTLDDLSLLHWVCAKFPALAASQALDGNVIESALRARLVGDVALPRGAARLALGWVALRSVAADDARPCREAVSPRPTAVSYDSTPTAWLAVATEWASGRGGLSTFNRELCRALAAAGHRVFCVVPESRGNEKEDAERAGVQLVVAPNAPGMSEEARLALRPVLPPGVTPQIVVGHGRITGPAARVLASSHFPAARRLHFLHMAPGAIDWFKDHAPDHDTAASAEERERLEVELAATAHLALAVGPLLQREFGRLVHPRGKRILEFLPGLGEVASEVSSPPGAQCLVLGRAEDLSLKGLDIAARALARVSASRPTLRPLLMVRGVPAGSGESLRAELMRRAGEPRPDIRVRNFTADALRVVDDLLQSTVVLMPSRSEGFGLVGLEAIALGIPLLVSSRSGLGELIEREASDLAPHVVVPVVDDLKKDGATWARYIEAVLQAPAAAFDRAARLRQAMADVLAWPRSVANLTACLENLALPSST